MKVLHIYGEGYDGQEAAPRIACRAVILKEGELLLSYETKNDKWMLPGGGLEADETDAECCVREVEEETGILAAVSDCFLEIHEYFPDSQWVNRYFLCREMGKGRKQLTKQEIKAGMEPRWLPLEEIKGIFGGHQAYAETDEMRRGLYFREFTALCELEQYLTDTENQKYRGSAS